MMSVLNGYLDQSRPIPGSQYKTDDAVLLLRQSPGGAPPSDKFDQISNPLVPPMNTPTQLSHFFDGLYDLSPESHISRLLKSILGDACMGTISKQFTQARMNDVILTTHFSDLDRLYGDVFGLRRFQGEALPFNPYSDLATPEAWADLHARDASYRNKIEAFSRGINQGGTPTGMEIAAEAMLGAPVQIYETWAFVDEAMTSPGGLNAANIGANPYSVLEAEHYSDLNRQTYSDIEGGIGSYGRTTSSNRSEFVVRPMRPISLEEYYQLIKVISRLKPAEALLTVDSGGVALHKPVLLRNVWSDSIYWEIRSTISTSTEKAPIYVQPKAVQKDLLTLLIERIEDFLFAPAIPQAKPAFSAFQGEKFAYNSDVVSIDSYARFSDGTVNTTGNWLHDVDVNGKVRERVPNSALATPQEILSGRLASDGIVVSSPYAIDRSQGAITATSSYRESLGSMGT